MFAARDQENLVHIRQTNAAGKPLNQGIKSLHPKTPGNVKTPFRPSRNDENQNVLLPGQKTLLKGGGSKLDQNAFVTPAATRPRAPLGAKTTNAKAQPLKTPGPGRTMRQDKSAKQLSSTRRSTRKITVAPTETVQQASVRHDADDEPDYGYAPPPIKELPDPPIDFGYDQEFPQFRPENMFKGYREIFFGSPKDENGISLRLKQEEEMYRLSGEKETQLLNASISRQKSTRSDPDAEVDALIAAGPNRGVQPRESKVNTLKAKSAAAALSAVSRAPGTRPIAPSAMSGRMAGLSTSRSSQSTTKPPFSVSRNTIGFPRAKQSPSILPPAQQKRPDQLPDISKTQRNIHPTEFVRLYGEPPVESEMWFRLKQHELLQTDSEGLFGTEEDLAAELADLDLFAPIVDDGDDCFQLPVPQE